MNSQNLPVNFKSMDKLKSDLKYYLTKETDAQEWRRKYNAFQDFIKVFAGAPLSLNTKIKYIAENFGQPDVDTQFCLQIIIGLVSCCDIDELLDQVIPLHKKVFTSLGRNYRGNCGQLITAIGETFLNENLTPTNFKRILAAHPAFGVMELEFGKVAAQNSSFALQLFAFLNIAVANEHFNDNDAVINILNIYFANFMSPFPFWESSKTNDVISTIHNLLRKNTDPQRLFNLLLVRLGIIESLEMYVDLLIDFANCGVSKLAIITLLKNELGEKNLLHKPVFQVLMPEYFGAVFYRLAKNGLLPSLKYDQTMAENVFTHITSLLSQEEQRTALKAIKAHEDTQLNVFFCEKPALALLGAKEHVLSKHWRKKINEALKALEQPEEIKDSVQRKKI